MMNVVPCHPIVDASCAPAGQPQSLPTSSGSHCRSGLGRIADTCALVAIVFAGAIFGFFYAWVCSTMWGLDAADPRVAIAAMQAMNASVRNALFFPAFFLTPLVLVLAGELLRRTARRDAALWFHASAALYLIGGLGLTMLVNVPMNERLADTAVPASLVDAELIWNDFSARWQRWNSTRAVLSGVSLLLAAIGLRHSAHP